ncbi:PREDICTED: uncharacterized protein LOC109210877 [Nicotiana attenuata]|uniref:uncharacterized protein LOC109210877 n=1 Tax=Nicotiana attenuata TaxID=49451 RepID=UPI000905180D|nr:PREDICTED: uncharacterized protein LOC109210877 [Nicotiana attenuata]
MAWSLLSVEQPVPHLHQKFHQADIMWRSEEDEALAGIRKLFQDTDDMDCISKMLKNDAATSWTEEFQKAFDKIKEYLSKPPVLKTVKGQALADHLAETPIDGEYEPLITYFPDEKVSFVGEDITKAYDGWGMFFDGAANFKGVGIGVVLLLETGQHYSIFAKLRFPCTNNMEEYEACILGLRLAIDMNVQKLLVIGDSDLLMHRVLGEWDTKNTKILPYLYRVQELIKRFTKMEFNHVPRIQNEFADALATLSSIQHPDKNFIDTIPIDS